MNRVPDGINQSLLETRQPEVEAHLCVHSIIGSASCTACVDACPLQAWVLDDAVLGLNTTACDGCGLCVPACPEGAIQPLYQPLKSYWNGRNTVMAACERTGPGEIDGVIPCVHGLGVRDLLIFYSQGITDLIVSCGDCSQCDRAQAPRLDVTVEQINRMLEQRGLHPIHYHRPTPEQWLNDRNTAMVPAPGVEMGRRSFLRRAMGLSSSEKRTEQRRTIDKTTWPTPPGRLIPTGDGSYILPFVPEIDIHRCNGCDVCVRLCPHQALTLELDESDDMCSYHIRPENCTGCNLCIDGCDENALSIISWNTPVQLSIDLTRARCPACGADYHTPHAYKQNEDGLCRICTVTNHYTSLHQVVD